MEGNGWGKFVTAIKKKCMEKQIEPSPFLHNERLAQTYEHFICKAFDCSRRGIWFADMAYYLTRNDSEQNKRNIRIFVAVALKTLVVYRKDDPYLKRYMPVFEKLLEKLDYDDTVEWAQDYIDKISVEDAIERLYETYCF